MEIERKFLVDSDKWEDLKKPVPTKIIQAYLHNDPKKTVRVRIKGEKGYLTIKGETLGISRKEYEYEIPLMDAEEMILQFADKIIEKDRYEMEVANHIWEIDVFHGKLSGLILAELELKSENEEFMKPLWVTRDVSTDENYFNAKLVNKC